MLKSIANPNQLSEQEIGQNGGGGLFILLELLRRLIEHN